jgi:hypothetical protein
MRERKRKPLYNKALIVPGPSSEWETRRSQGGVTPGALTQGPPLGAQFSEGYGIVPFVPHPIRERFRVRIALGHIPFTIRTHFALAAGALGSAI